MIKWYTVVVDRKSNYTDYIIWDTYPEVYKAFQIYNATSGSRRYVSMGLVLDEHNTDKYYEDDKK